MFNIHYLHAAEKFSTNTSVDWLCINFKPWHHLTRDFSCKSQAFYSDLGLLFFIFQERLNAGLLRDINLNYFETS